MVLELLLKEKMLEQQICYDKLNGWHDKFNGSHDKFNCFSRQILHDSKKL